MATRATRATKGRPARPSRQATPDRAARRVSEPDAAASPLLRVRRASVGFVRRLWAWSAPYRAAAAPWVAKARTVLGFVSPLGWLLLAVAVVAAVLGARLGWRELSYLAGTLVALFVIACLFTIGRAHLTVSLDLAPQRVTQGDSAAAQVKVTNVGRTPLLPMGLIFPVGASEAPFTLPLLAPGASYEDLVLVPTSRRGVVPVGPVTTQRGDPFGVVRREVVWTDAHELFVHPTTVPLETLGAGLLRDLEGRTTQDISMSDLAFHTLREYTPGDDRRYIHWRSSAKLAGHAGSDRFLVRQFLDTRRSHLAVVVDVAESSYRDAEDFELALQVGASIVRRALLDELDLTIVCGAHAATQPPPHVALDTFSRAELDGWSLGEATGQLGLFAPDVSVVVLITGSQCDFSQFLHARAFLAPEVATAAITVSHGSRATLREVSGIPVVSLGNLRELPRVMAGGQVA